MIVFIAQWFVNALGVLAAGYFVPGVSVTSFYIALIVAAFLGVLNLLVRPILVVLTLPITLLTLGLFTFVINALLFWFLASFIQGFAVAGFFAAFVGALVVSAISFIGRHFIEMID
ncbi:MAG: phage holin family protein [Candidatus Lloydbacteria bacterium]|nr:phage holin family protein [Candidatus Lloydbacteria bacterium]